MSSTLPWVSVIVPVRNGADDLASLLECLAKQTLAREQFEIVVADDGSTDGGTDEVATSDGHVRVIEGPPLNAYAARNRAVAASRAPVLAFCDADCRPEPNWLERGLSALNEADIIAGRIRMQIPPHPSVWALLDAESTKDHARQVAVGNAETANLFLHRALYDRVGPFDVEQPGYGDFEFVLRCVSNGATLAYASDAIVTHPVRMGGRAFLRNVWAMNHSYATFESRSGRLPDGVRLREWVPVIQTVRARRRFGMSTRLDRRWMGENGFRPRLRDDLRALPITYLFLPYFCSVAQLVGWITTRRRHSEQPENSSAIHRA